MDEFIKQSLMRIAYKQVLSKEWPKIKPKKILKFNNKRGC